MSAGIARVIDDDTGLVHWAYFMSEVYERVQAQVNALVVTTTICIANSTRLAPGKRVTCIRCMARFIDSAFSVIDGT